MTKLVLTVSGMHCHGCAYAVQMTLKHARGVSKAHVHLKTGEAFVQYDPKKTTPKDVVQRVVDVGFQASIKKNGE